jgi:hypothetical protein
VRCRCYCSTDPVIFNSSHLGPPINGALLTGHFVWWRPALFSGVRNPHYNNLYSLIILALQAGGICRIRVFCGRSRGTAQTKYRKAQEWSRCGAGRGSYGEFSATVTYFSTMYTMKTCLHSGILIWTRHLPGSEGRRGISSAETNMKTPTL